MRDLKTLREGWDDIARDERRSARHLTIEQSVSIFLSLSQSTAPLMKETEEAFLRYREAYLTELQARLRRLNSSGQQ
jgi:hypothetical protein